MVEESKKTPPTGPKEELKLSELLILASMWMLFGFMLWFYLSAFHGAPTRIAADAILSHILGSDFSRIIVEPNGLPIALFKLFKVFLFNCFAGTNKNFAEHFID